MSTEEPPLDHVDDDTPVDEAPTLPHVLSLVVWETPAPAVIGRSPTLKVGVHCDNGCNLLGQIVEVHGDDGTPAGAATLNRVLETDALHLYWAHLPLSAPVSTGVSRYTAQCCVQDLEPDHTPAEQAFGFAVDVHPQHNVDVRVVHSDTGEPCADVEVRLGRYERYTDARGEARLNVPTGVYLATLRRLGLKAEPVTLTVETDTTIELVAQKGETREELEARLSEMENRPWA